MGYAYGRGYGHTWKPNKRRVTTPSVPGGAGLLVNETNGFATDFLYATDASRVAVKVAGAVTSSALDSFFQNAGTSPKMVYDASGVLVWSPHNMCLRSEDFTNAVWAQTGTPSPTAHTLTDNDAGVIEFVSQSITTIIGVTYTVTTWFLKDAVTSRFSASVIVSSTTMITVLNTSTGALSHNASTLGGTGVVVDTGTHWKVTQTFVAAGITTSIRLFPARDTVFQSTGGGAAAAVGSVTIDRVQMNRGAVATDYLMTTSAARYGLAVDYDPVTHAAKGLLCEPAKTNVIKWSNDLSNAVWTTDGTGTVTANTAVAPNGRTEASKVTASGANAYVWQSPITSTTGTISIYAKTAELSQIFLVLGGVVDGFDLIVGTTFTYVALGPSSGGAAIRSVGNGWYRCSMPVTAAVDLTVYLGSNNELTLAGDAGKGIYLWGAQFETGAVATSLIPTLGATVTRAMDRYSITPASINYSSTAGSWWVDITIIEQQVYGDRIIGMQSFMNPMSLNSFTQFEMFNGSSAITIMVPTNTLGNNKISSAFQNADMALTAAGLAPATGTHGAAGTGLLNPGAIIAFGSDTGGTLPLFGYFRKIRYVPRRKSNAEMVTETT